MTLHAMDVGVDFGGVRALDGVDVEVAPGTIGGIIGPNGSGKTTLFNCLSGFVTAERGALRLDDQRIDGLPPEQRIRNGLGRTFQTPRLDPAATVADTVACGFYTQGRAGMLRSLLRTPGVRRLEHEIREQTEELLRAFALDTAATVPVGDLSLGKVRLVEVARAVATRPSYLLLDEPAAGLTEAEQEMLSGEVRRLAAAGVGVLLVEHNFGLVQKLCDHLAVLANGRVLASGPPADVAEDPAVVEAYLGAAAREHDGEPS